jgi:rifampicin phosphotransferase
MEQMMGVKESTPGGNRAELAATGRRGRVLDSVYLARTLAGCVVNHLTLNRRVDAFYRRLDAALASAVAAARAQRPDELVAHYRDLRGRCCSHWDAPLVNDFFAMIFYGLLKSLSTSVDRSGGTIQNDLISGEGGIVSAEPAVRMQRMARIAAGDPACRDAGQAVRQTRPPRPWSRHPELAAEYRAYLEKFGERTVNELKLESTTLVDDPTAPSRDRRAGQAGGPARAQRGTPSSGDRLRADAARRVADALRGHPLRRVCSPGSCATRGGA